VIGRRQRLHSIERKNQPTSTSRCSKERDGRTEREFPKGVARRKRGGASIVLAEHPEESHLFAHKTV